VNIQGDRRDSGDAGGLIPPPPNSSLRHKDVEEYASVVVPKIGQVVGEVGGEVEAVPNLQVLAVHALISKKEHDPNSDI
jgi:hypothetical protein